MSISETITQLKLLSIDSMFRNVFDGCTTCELKHQSKWNEQHNWIYFASLSIYLSWPFNFSLEHNFFSLYLFFPLYTLSVRVSTNNGFLYVGTMNCNSFRFGWLVCRFSFSFAARFSTVCRFVLCFLFGVLMRSFSSIPSSAYGSLFLRFVFLRSLQLWCDLQLKCASLKHTIELRMLCNIHKFIKTNSIFRSRSLSMVMCARWDKGFFIP